MYRKFISLIIFQVMLVFVQYYLQTTSLCRTDSRTLENSNDSDDDSFLSQTVPKQPVSPRQSDSCQVTYIPRRNANIIKR